MSNVSEQVVQSAAQAATKAPGIFALLGTAPQWLTLGAILWGVWKTLPSVIEAIDKALTNWSTRASAERGRIDEEFRRLERQLEAADERHRDCQETVSELRKEVASLHETINAMRRQMVQMQASTVNMVTGRDENPMLGPLIRALDAVPGQEGKH